MRGTRESAVTWSANELNRYKPLLEWLADVT